MIRFYWAYERFPETGINHHYKSENGYKRKIYKSDFVLKADVRGQRCPDSVRNYCVVSVDQNQVQIRNLGTRKPSRLKISDFD